MAQRPCDRRLAPLGGDLYRMLDANFGEHTFSLQCHLSEHRGTLLPLVEEEGDDYRTSGEAAS